MSALVQPSEIHRVSIDEYHRMIRSGGLSEDTRVELIDGFIVDRTPRGPAHENAVRAFIDWLRALADRFAFCVRSPLTLGNSEPEPNVSIIERGPPALEHPSHALLVIEVAVSSHDRDLRSRPAVYAPYVAEYWVVDLERSCVLVHRDPVDGAYRDVTLAARGETIAPHAVPIAPLDSHALFATVFAEPR